MRSDSQHFFELVQLMRKAQKQYFRNRNRENLLIAKQLENQVDGIINLEVVAELCTPPQQYPIHFEEG
jgi:hypothetical protein